jgi:hypothetical protein
MRVQAGVIKLFDRINIYYKFFSRDFFSFQSFIFSLTIVIYTIQYIHVWLKIAIGCLTFLSRFLKKSISNF